MYPKIHPEKKSQIFKVSEEWTFTHFMGTCILNYDLSLPSAYDKTVDCPVISLRIQQQEPVVQSERFHLHKVEPDRRVFLHKTVSLHNGKVQ